MTARLISTEERTYAFRNIICIQTKLNTFIFNLFIAGFSVKTRYPRTTMYTWMYSSDYMIVLGKQFPESKSEYGKLVVKAQNDNRTWVCDLGKYIDENGMMQSSYTFAMAIGLAGWSSQPLAVCGKNAFMTICAGRKCLKRHKIIILTVSSIGGEVIYWYRGKLLVTGE